MVEARAVIVYLGSLLSADGRADEELSRRLGMAGARFRELTVVWGRSRISTRRRLRLFNAYVGRRVMYALHPCWLNATERRRLDGFEARCLRRIHAS